VRGDLRSNLAYETGLVTPGARQSEPIDAA
jgi:hypothetical protein